MKVQGRPPSAACVIPLLLIAALLLPSAVRGDGKVVRPRDYAGSLEERAQEAIIIFQGSDTKGQAVEDLILKIQVAGAVDRFAWVVPFPKEPTVKREEAALFRELHAYVEARLAGFGPRGKKSVGAAAKDKASAPKGVEVLSRQVVGKYDVAVVKENKAGALNDWLKKEGYQTLTDAEDVIGFYRKKEYVFACIKVDDAQLGELKKADLHPLRFTFQTGGRDGIYFPMRMTGLQKEPFDVNLYVFYRFWLNDHRSKYGFEHRGFRLRYRDWDSPECEADAGKGYSNPNEDPFLRSLAGRLPTVTKLFQKLHPGEKYYLTNIQALGLKPGDVREWPDDLWLFPYYINTKHVPHDARKGGPASAAWPNAEEEGEEESEVADFDPWPWVIGGGLLLVAGIVTVRVWRRRDEE